MNPRNRPSPASPGFTLIELLVVITVISILLAFSAPALFSGLGASRLSGAGDKVLTVLSEAQQTAFAQNVAVEVQFYAYQGTMDNQTMFRSLRMFKVTSPSSSTASTTALKENTTSLGAIINLPDGVVISSDSSLSPSLTGTTLPDVAENSGVPAATYAAIRFLPDGTCRKVSSLGSGVAVLEFLSLPTSFFTLLEDDGGTYSGASPPKNFYTIQTDPYTGKSRYYRPGF
jgi:uncharacterized protein (TIGR02596 family)